MRFGPLENLTWSGGIRSIKVIMYTLCTTLTLHSPLAVQLCVQRRYITLSVETVVSREPGARARAKYTTPTRPMLRPRRKRQIQYRRSHQKREPRARFRLRTLSPRRLVSRTVQRPVDTQPHAHLAQASIAQRMRRLGCRVATFAAPVRLSISAYGGARTCPRT